VEMMDVDVREEPSAPLPPPPEGAVKMRCYKLNLESELVSINSSSKPPSWLGPYEEPIPFLTYSSSSDSSNKVSERSVAIQTAQIFRGITVSRDGTILTLNARATRSNRGNKTKRGEKSRQAAKIDKAKDLVEESIITGKAPDSDDPANMVSLYIVGEYDDMKQLVRDGSKKLRDAEGLPDEVLLSVNKLRPGSQKLKQQTSSASVLLSPRKRMSPNFVNGQRTAAMQTPEKIQAATVVAASNMSVGGLSPSGAGAGGGSVNAATVSSVGGNNNNNNSINMNNNSNLPQSAPPKLKSHPRDTRPGRREDRTGPRVRLDSCHDFMDPRRGITGDGADWSHAWNIWNCGAGTISPMQPSSPTTDNTSSNNNNNNSMNARNPVFEGRDSSNNYGNGREGGVTSRAN
jgi:hypothetical protein